MDKSAAIRLSGILQTSLATLAFAGGQLRAYVEGDDSVRNMTELVGRAMASLCEAATLLYGQHLEAVPPDMRPPGAQTDDELRDAVETWAAAFTRLDRPTNA